MKTMFDLPLIILLTIILILLVYLYNDVFTLRKDMSRYKTLFEQYSLRGEGVHVWSRYCRISVAPKKWIQILDVNPQDIGTGRHIGCAHELGGYPYPARDQPTPKYVFHGHHPRFPIREIKR